ncbi:MAG: hypothetical protein ACRDWT_13115 [Jatrophihabitantaceae bacterium]
MAVPKSVEHALDTALDKALKVQRPIVQAYLERVRSKQPHASPAMVVAQLERRYTAAAVGIGAASGGAAAVPGVGTATSVAAGAAEITAFVSATAMYVLALAELHGVPVSNPDVRRALVLGVLVGGEGAAAIDDMAGAGRHWAQVINRPDAKSKIAGINARLAHLLLTRFGARQGALLVGRALPLGIGAGIGAAGNAALARAAITAARRAFGQAPASFPGRVIDVDPLP